MKVDKRNTLKTTGPDQDQPEGLSDNNPSDNPDSQSDSDSDSTVRNCD